MFTQLRITKEGMVRETRRFYTGCPRMDADFNSTLPGRRLAREKMAKPLFLRWQHRGQNILYKEANCHRKWRMKSLNSRWGDPTNSWIINSYSTKEFCFDYYIYRYNIQPVRGLRSYCSCIYIDSSLIFVWTGFQVYENALESLLHVGHLNKSKLRLGATPPLGTEATTRRDWRRILWMTSKSNNTRDASAKNVKRN